MPYVPHLAITAAGGMPGGERWSCTLTYGNGVVGVATQDEAQAVAQAAVAPWSAFMVANASKIVNGVTLQRVTARVITAAGTTAALGEAAPAATVAGNNSLLLPNQCAVVLSLRTATPGPRGRGRIFLPALAAAPNGAGRLDPATRDGILAQSATLVAGLREAVETNTASDLWSLVVASGAGQGLLSRVNSLRVGDVIDTQRRRRDALVESYSSVPV